MHNQAEKRTWLSFILERFRIHKDIATKDFDEFLEIVAKKHPPQVNVSIIKQAKTTVGSPDSVGTIHHHEFTTLFSFALDPKSLSLAKYIEDYPESGVLEGDTSAHLKTLNEMKIRAILTAINRTKQINSRFPSIPTQINVADSEGILPLNDVLLRFTQSEAQRLKLSPFII